MFTDGGGSNCPGLQNSCLFIKFSNVHLDTAGFMKMVPSVHSFNEHYLSIPLCTLRSLGKRFKE